MKLLLDERNLVIGIGSEIEYGVWGNLKDCASWKINQSSYAMDNNYRVEDIGDTEIPTYVREGEYFYVDGEFRLADECPNEYKERITELEGTVAEQETSIYELTEYNAEMLYEISLLQLGIME